MVERGQHDAGRVSAVTKTRLHPPPVAVARVSVNTREYISQRGCRPPESAVQRHYADPTVAGRRNKPQYRKVLLVGWGTGATTPQWPSDTAGPELPGRGPDLNQTG